MDKLDFVKKAKETRLFENMPEKELMSIDASLFETRILNEDEQLISEGDDSKEVFLIIEGSMDIVKQSEISRKSVLYTRVKGDILGESAIFQNIRRTADIYAAERSEVINISRENLLQLIELYPQIQINIFKTLRERYHESDNKALQEIEQQNILLEMNDEIVYQRDELKILNDKLQETLSKLENSHKELVEMERKNSVLAMAVTANHELNQPLMILQGNLEMLINTFNEAEFTEKQKKFLSRITDSLQRMDMILNRYEKIKNIRFDNYSDSSLMVVIEDD